jgi:hypothetical protein
MTQVKDLRNNQTYQLIRMENVLGILNQQFIVNDNGVERIIPVKDGRVL